MKGFRQITYETVTIAVLISDAISLYSPRESILSPTLELATQGILLTLNRDCNRSEQTGVKRGQGVFRRRVTCIAKPYRWDNGKAERATAQNETDVDQVALGKLFKDGHGVKMSTISPCLIYKTVIRMNRKVKGKQDN